MKVRGHVPFVSSVLEFESRQRLDVFIGSHNSSLEGAMKLKFVPFCSCLDALSDGIMF